MRTETDTVGASRTATLNGIGPHELDQLIEITALIASARNAMSDEMVARLARVVSEGAALLDRLTRNEALLQLLRSLERPEGQRMLIAMAKAIGPAAAQIAAAPASGGGIAGLWKLAREPGTQDALRCLAVFGTCWAESARHPA